MHIWQAITLSIVEGLTEYLPISSTGHMIIVSSMMGIQESPFTKDFTVMVQFGAILAVFFEYFRLFLRSWNIYKILFVGLLPAAIIGVLVKDKIDILLGSVWLVGWTTLIGGFILLATDQIFPDKRAIKRDVEKLTWKDSLVIGFFQCMAFFPGVSRSAASIWGGLTMKLDQTAATEFSFLLALPTLSGATLLKGLKAYHSFGSNEWHILLLGNAISFVVGWLAIRTFIQIVSKYGLKWFGLYRVILGVVVLTMLFTGTI